MIGITLIVVFAPLVACGDDSNGGTVAEQADKQGSGERRTDLKPLTDRFDALGEPVDAVWLSGTLGSERAPGPSSFWIDAVVTLDPAVAADLRDRHAPTRTDEVPSVIDDLSDDIPDGLTSSTELDAAFSTNGFVTDAYLAVDTDIIVLVSRGQ